MKLKEYNTNNIISSIMEEIKNNPVTISVTNPVTNQSIKNKVFDSLDNQHQISIVIIDEISWFEIKLFNPDRQKTFVLLLKEVIDYYRGKNVQFIKQYVNEDDVTYFKNSTKQLIDDNVYIVTTPIVSFIDDMVSVLGIIKM